MYNEKSLSAQCGQMQRDPLINQIFRKMEELMQLSTSTVEQSEKLGRVILEIPKTAVAKGPCETRQPLPPMHEELMRGLEIIENDLRIVRGRLTDAEI